MLELMTIVVRRILRIFSCFPSAALNRAVISCYFSQMVRGRRGALVPVVTGSNLVDGEAGTSSTDMDHNYLH